MSRTTTSERLTKMEKDIEYIKLSLDELKEGFKEFRQDLQDTRDEFSVRIEQKVDRSEMWKIISIAVSITALIASLIARMVV